MQLLDQYETGIDHKLVFEKVDGGELFAHIQERITFTEHEASLVTQNLASAVSFLHSKGIVHRDLKPQNILCVTKESASPCKICDLGLGYVVARSTQGRSTRRAAPHGGVAVLLFLLC